MNILCLIPVDHVDGVKDKLSSLGYLLYFPKGLSKLSVWKAAKYDGIDVIYTNPNKQKYILDVEALSGTNVRTIVTVSKGTNHIDMEYCEEAGIHVIHLNRDPVVAKNSAAAEHALGLTLALIKFLPQSLHSVIKGGQWDYTPFIGHQLSSFTVGVIGMGILGKMYASYCQAIGAKVLICTRQVPDSFKHVMSNSDVISLHVPLTDDNYHMINEEAIDWIKASGAFIVNTSRGGIVDEEAVIAGLRSGKVKGYATDVLEDEAGEIRWNHLVTAKNEEELNIIITPHVAGTCFESAQTAHFRAIELLEKSQHMEHANG